MSYRESGYHTSGLFILSGSLWGTFIYRNSKINFLQCEESLSTNNLDSSSKLLSKVRIMCVKIKWTNQQYFLVHVQLLLYLVTFILITEVDVDDVVYTTQTISFICVQNGTLWG